MKVASYEDFLEATKESVTDKYIREQGECANKLKKPTKRKATITLSTGNYSVETKDTKGKVYPKGTPYISVSFDGHNEGGSSTYKTEAEAQAQVEYLENTHEEEYKIKKIDERTNTEKYNELLNGWKEVLVDYCKEKNQEIEHIWFDTSVPYECEVAIRMKGHKGCYYNCVSFRFQNGLFKAWDSNFNGGTTFVDNGFADSKDINGEKDEILKIMDRVFEKECEASGWGENEQKDILINDEGWKYE